MLRGVEGPEKQLVMGFRYSVQEFSFELLVGTIRTDMGDNTKHDPPSLQHSESFLFLILDSTIMVDSLGISSCSKVVVGELLLE
jgi:hypothetical protein